MTTTTNWADEQLTRIAANDDLHVAPCRENGRTGTPTWIWSVAVDQTLHVRAYNGSDSSWYQSAMRTGRGIIQSGGETIEVRFLPVDDKLLNERIDEAYAEKYAGNPYLAPMVAAGPRATTVAVTPAA
jgi:hypothetical protein